MPNPGMNVIDVSCHGLDRLQVRRHQAFAHRAPVAEIGGEAQAGVLLEPEGQPPGIEQTAASMRLQHHRTGHLLKAIQHRRKKIVLFRVCPAVAAGDQVDLQRQQRPCASQGSIELLEMLVGTVAEAGGVIPACDDFQDQGLIESTQCLEQMTGADGFKAGMIQVDLDAVKTGCTGTLEGLIEGSTPTPECLEQKKLSGTQNRPAATNLNKENLAVSSVECQDAATNSVINS